MNIDNTAYLSASSSNIWIQESTRGFRSTGIHPTNHDIFADHDFIVYSHHRAKLAISSECPRQIPFRSSAEQDLPSATTAAQLTLRPWRWRRYAPPKRRIISTLHGVISYKTTTSQLWEPQIQYTVKCLSCVKSSTICYNANIGKGNRLISYNVWRSLKRTIYDICSVYFDAHVILLSYSDWAILTNMTAGACAHVSSSSYYLDSSYRSSSRRVSQPYYLHRSLNWISTICIRAAIGNPLHSTPLRSAVGLNKWNEISPVHSATEIR
jgi:hypothetical protein